MTQDDMLAIVQADVTDLWQKYQRVLRMLEATWRDLYNERDALKAAKLEAKQRDLTQAARILAGRHERAVRALDVLERKVEEHAEVAA